MWCMVDWYRFRFLDLLILFLHKKSATFDLTWCSCDVQGRCNREKPACKYFHPPQHLKVSLAHHWHCGDHTGIEKQLLRNIYINQDQLLINGRNHLALKNALAQQMQQQMIPGQVPAVVSSTQSKIIIKSLICPAWLVGKRDHMHIQIPEINMQMQKIPTTSKKLKIFPKL